MSAKPDTRETILEAAEEIVVAQGATHLTLDAVAARAGVSKGGLLYHFPTKEALLAGMIERLVTSFREEKLRLIDSGPECPGALLLAHVNVVTTKDERCSKVGAALLAAVANNPALIEPARQYIHSDMRAMFEGIADFPSAALLFLASEGLHHLKLLGIDPFRPEEYQQVCAELCRRVANVK